MFGQCYDDSESIVSVEDKDANQISVGGLCMDAALYTDEEAVAKYYVVSLFPFSPSFIITPALMSC